MKCFAAILVQRTAAPPWRANRLGAPLLAAGLALLGCSEDGAANSAGVDAAGSGAGPSAPAIAAGEAFACSDATRSEPEQLKRLTMTQYKNTIRDLTHWVLGDRVEADTIVTLAGLDNVPLDRREPDARAPHGSYRRLDQAVDQTHVDETFRVASALATSLTKPGRLGRVAGACATDADPENDAACFASFVQRFGERALRRPLDADDEAFYRTFYGEDPTVDAAAYADLITVMLSAPEFLYLVEHGEAAVPDQRGSYELSPFELASRLAYHFWQTLPDDALWQAARDRSLLQPAVLAAQVQRMLLDPRARETMTELFADWLELEALPPLDAHVKDPVYTAFARDDLPGSDLRAHVIEDALDMLSYYTWTVPGGIEELFTSELSFARAEDLARIYGVARWDGNSPPPALPSGERPGLLSHAWFLAGASANTRPILRGVFARRQLLCDDLPPPPANANAIPPELRSDRTTRQVVEELTQQPDTACAGCHATRINPLGFAFEGFDALGRQRAEQRLLSDSGEVVGALPIDTATVPRVTPLDESVSTGPADLMRLMLASGKLEACFARNYFRFTFGRYEDLARDGCALERLRARLVQSGRVRDMLAEAALLPELKQRRFEP
jgi:hypothetical protein